MDVRQDAADEVTGRVLAMLTALVGGAGLAADQDYMAEGLVDSIMALELVTGVEQSFGIEIGVEDLDLDNFRTAERIAAFVRRKRAGGGPGAVR